MSLTRKRGHWYGTSQKDIRAEIIRYSIENGYEATQFADAKCKCGGGVFSLLIDDNEGCAARTCVKCDDQHPIGDSEEYLDDAELFQPTCLCEAEQFEVTVGVALYEKSDDVRWLYLGCRCPKCGLVGCYGDWKNEFNGYKKLLKMV